MKREPLSTGLRGLTAVVDGRLMVSVDGETIIKSAFLESGPSTDRQPVDGLVDAPSTKVDEEMAVLQATIDMLQEQLKVKDRQIEQQDQIISRLTDALVAAQQTAAAAQALHAGTMKQRLLSDEARDDQQKPKVRKKQKRSWFDRFLMR